jgi:hypothetical protein
MKRVFFEWGAIATSALAMFCFGYWAVLLYFPEAKLEMFFPLGHWKSTQLVVSDGIVTINDHLNSRLEIETAYRVLNPPATSETYWSYPGFVYQSINWGGRLKWSMQCSLLLPALMSSAAAAVFILGYLRIRREALRAFFDSRRGGETLASGT